MGLAVHLLTNAMRYRLSGPGQWSNYRCYISADGHAASASVSV